MSSGADPLLEMSEVTVRHRLSSRAGETRGRASAVEAASLTVGRGELVGLIGPNGAGKTTLMRAALGLIDGCGEILLQGEPSTGLSALKRAQRVAYLAQGHEIGWPLSVEAVVALGREPYRTLGLGLGSGLSEADHRLVDAAMRRMDVERFRQRPVTELSGGEQARVLIARALAQDAPLLIADEPTAGLDPSHQIVLMQTLEQLAREGRGVLVSLHDLTMAGRWCSRLVVMQRGRVVADGTPQEVLTKERLAAVYGISARIQPGPSGIDVVPEGLAE